MESVNWIEQFKYSQDSNQCNISLQQSLRVMRTNILKTTCLC